MRVPDVTLLLWGRDDAVLRDVTAAVPRARRGGARPEFSICAISAGLAAKLAAADAATPIDLAIFNAGLGGTAPDDCAAEAPETAQAVAEVNFVAPVVGANVIADAMAKRGGGPDRAGWFDCRNPFRCPWRRPMPRPRRGLRMFAEALGLRLARHGVMVTLVSPGFIDTPMSRKVTEPKPFLIDRR